MCASWDGYSIVVHSHLKWDWVWQGPQQFLSRLSRQHRVLFVENPDSCDDVADTRAQLREVGDFSNISVLEIKILLERRNDTPRIDNERHRVVHSLLRGPLGKSFSPIVQWFYDPIAVTGFAGQLDVRSATPLHIAPPAGRRVQ